MTENRIIVERPRRLRRTPALRRLVRETTVEPSGLIQPLFVREGLKAPHPIASMPGIFQHSESSFRAAVSAAAQAKVGGIMIFGVPDERDAHGAAACSDESVLAKAIAWAKSEVGDELPVIADLCLDEFTSHGHCGVLNAAGGVDNDATLAVYERMACVLASAGADILGLSGMMDGQIEAVRNALEGNGRTEVALLAYAAKFASAFYGPFRDAVESPLIGDRRSYQQDPANGCEALREVRLDIAQGADIVMIKPALAYLDVIAKVKSESVVPVAAYLVSGEYAMIEAAAAAGMIVRENAISEVLTSVTRAGASIIATYWATEFASLSCERKQ